MAQRDAAIQVGEAAGRYIAAWNEPDPDARRRVVTGTWLLENKNSPPQSPPKGR